MAGKLKLAEQEVRNTERSIRTSKNTKEDLKEKLEVMDSHGGRFTPMIDACVEKNIDKYLYKICFFKSAKQGSTRLGDFDKWGGENGDDTSVMLFSEGDRCWQGPARTLKVHLACGAEPEMLDITEPSMCVYESRVLHPSACTEGLLEELKDSYVPPAKLPHEHFEL